MSIDGRLLKYEYSYIITLNIIDVAKLEFFFSDTCIFYGKGYNLTQII